METTKKTSTKVLSLFLSVVLALSCFSLALPSLLPGAGAAASTTQWNALKSAFDAAKNAGYMNSSSYTNGCSITQTDYRAVSITDNTSGSYYWNIVVALQAVFQNEWNNGYNSNPQLQARIRDYSGWFNSYQKEFINMVVSTNSILCYYSGGKAYQQAGGYDNSYPAIPGNYWGDIGNVTYTVTRSMKAAILAQSTMPAQNASLATTASWTSYVQHQTDGGSQWQSGGYNSTWTTGSGTNESSHSEWHFYGYSSRYEWFTIYNCSGMSYGYTNIGTTLDGIRNYNAYVSGSDFSGKYNNYVSNSSSVYYLDTSYLAGIESAYMPYYNAAKACDEQYRNKWLNSAIENQYNYVKACTGAYTAAQYKAYADWITTDGFHAEAGDIAHDVYTFTTDGGIFGTTAEYNNIKALKNQAQNYLSIVKGLTSETQTALANVYGYSEAAYNDLITELGDYIELHELKDIYDQVSFRMSHDSTECYGGDASLFGVADYESHLYPGAWTEVVTGTEGEADYYVEMVKNEPENWPMTDEMESAARSWFNSQVSSINNYKTSNINTVFESPTFQNVKDMASYLQVEYDYREIEEEKNYSFYEYFEPYIHGVDYNTKSDKTVEDVIALLESKYTSLNTLYNQATSKLGATKRNQIFGSYLTEVRTYIDSLYRILYTRLYNQEYAMVYAALDHDDNNPADEITLANFSKVKRGIRDIDADLYTYVTSTQASKFNSVIGTAAINQLKTWYSWIPAYEAKITQVMNAKWSGFNQKKLDTPAGSGTYTTRYVDYYGNDMVRDDPNHNGADKYIVSETKINTVVTKLDTFVNSPDFTKLIGVYDEEKGITSLGKYVDNLLTEAVFNDKIVNTLIALLLPMVCDLLNTKIDELLSDLEIDGYHCSLTPRDGYRAALNVENLIKATNGGSTKLYSGDDPFDGGFWATGAGVNNISGRVDLAYDGAQSTKSFADEFHNLGLNIYPQWFGNSLPASINGVSLSGFKSALSAAGSSHKGMGGWLYFDTVNPTYTTVDKKTGGNVTVDRRTEEGGNTYGDGEITADDFMAYKWGCKDYNSFCNALGAVFGCITPLIRCLFTNYTFSATTSSNFLKANVDAGADAKARASKILQASGHADIRARGYGIATITIGGLQGYNNIWAPIFEALGISGTTSDQKPTQDSAPLSSTIGTAGSGADITNLVHALIRPLLALINKLDTAPVSTLCSILPMAAMCISTDMLTPLLDILVLNIHIDATVTISDVDNVTLWDWADFTWLAGLFKDKINDALRNVVDQDLDPISIGDMLTGDDGVLSQEKLGMDITDLNSIANFIVGKIGDDEEESDDRAVAIPAINAGELAQLGSKETYSSLRTVNLSSSLGSKQRYYIKARQADVLYHLVMWVLEFAAQDGNVSGLLVTLGQDALDADISALIAEIDAEGALAALVELFVPQDYAFEPYKWYTPNSSASTFNFGSSADFVYTMYGNDWTLDKAEYMYNELETVVNSVFDMIDEDIFDEIGVNGINELAQYYINSIFNNDGIMNVIKLVNGIGESLAGNDFVVNLVKEQLQTGGADANIDLLAWYDSFGYLTFDYEGYIEKIDEKTAEKIAEINADTELTAEQKTAKIEAANESAAEEKALAPKKPGEAGYENKFPNLQVTSEIKKDAETGENVVDDDGENVLEYHWSYRTGTTAPWQALVDNADDARQIFTHIFCELVRPFSPILDMILCGKDLSAFAGAIVINGYDCYEGAILPVLEALGIKGLKTQAQYTAYSNEHSSGEAFDYLVDELFDYVTDLLTIETITVGGEQVEYGPVQKLIDLLPRIFYFLQSDGLTTLIKNLLHPVWAVIDTLRPILNADLDGVIHLFLVNFTGLAYDETNTADYPVSVIAKFIMGLLPEDLFEDVEKHTVDAATIAEDKPFVDAIWAFSIEDLSLPKISNLISICFGIDLTPAIYAFEGMCVSSTRNGVNYGVKSYTSSGDTDWTWQPSSYGWKELDFYGPDTITVTFCTVIDLLRYGDNAAALDKLLGLVRDAQSETAEAGGAVRLPLSEDFTASGLLEAITMLLEDSPVALTGDAPNWDYLLENKIVKTGNILPGGIAETALYEDVIGNDYTSFAQYSGIDIQEYHSLYQLSYVTDWTPDIADNIDQLLSESLDYIITLIDKDKGGATTLADFVNRLLQENLFSGALLKKLADLIGMIYDLLPESVIDVVDNLLDINITGWKQYVKKQTVVDAEGNPVLDENGEETQSYQADPDHPWWADETAAEYVDTDDEFYDAINAIIQECAPLFGLIFLGDDYRLLRTIGDGVGSANYGNDAIVFNGLNAYSRGIIPILEAFGCDLTNYKPEKYVISDGVYDSELFVSDLFDIVKDLIDNILADPYEYIIDMLPNITYFTNANGWSVSVQNIVGAVYNVLDTVNLMLDEDERIYWDTLLGKFIKESDTDLVFLRDWNLTNINLESLFVLLENFLGIYIRDDLSEYIRTLYVGVLEPYTSANGMGAFRMNTNKEFLDTETGRYKEGRGDFITILLSLIIEVATDAGTYIDGEGNEVAYDNAKALDKLLAETEYTPKLDENGDPIQKTDPETGEPMVDENGEPVYEMEEVPYDESSSGMVSTIVNILRNPTDPTYFDIDWDYFDETLNLSDSADNVVNIKAYQFLYLNYSTDWTEAKAENVVGEFDNLLLAVLQKLDDSYADATSASDIISDLLNLDSFYSAETLQGILDFVSPLLYGEDAAIPEALLNLAGALLGADLSSWNYTYCFADKDDEVTYTEETETGLYYAMITTDILDENEQPTGETKTMKTYAIDGRDDFVNGLSLVLEPANRLFAWILFGQGYEFFIKNTDETLESRLLTIGGAQGYKYGLALLLEAFGIDDALQTEDKYLIGFNAVDNTFTGVDMQQFTKDFLNSLCARVDELIADPVGEIEGLVSELIYFINAGGLQNTIRNLAGALLNLLDAVSEAGLVEGLDIDGLLGGLINGVVNGDLDKDDPDYVDVQFSLDGINLEYIFYIAELVTGLTINDVVGNTLEYFKIGQVYPYASNSGLLAYKMRFSTDEDFADFVTILLSFVIDIFETEGNAAALAALINGDKTAEDDGYLDPALLVSIAAFLRDSYTVSTNRIDWFYFDGANTLYNPDGSAKDPAPVYDADTSLSVQENVINYLSYASNWTKTSADAIYQNRNELIASVLKILDSNTEAETIGDLISANLDLNEVLYNKENLEKILDLVKGFTTDLDSSIKEILNIIIDVDLAAYDTMEVGEVSNRTQFASELNAILQPIARILDWLLFGQDIQYFDKKTDTEGTFQILINLPGSDGYSSALIPILEMLGVNLPAVKATDTCDDVLFTLINNVLARVETILANPVDEVLAMLPNVIYFINTNALSTCVFNLLAPVVALLDEIGPTVGIGTVDELLAGLFEDSEIEIDVNKLDWLAIFEIVEGATGLEITDVLTENKIDKFFFGGMSAYESANGKTAFRMDYNESQDPADMLTFILNLLVEILVYKNGEINNAAAIDALLGTDGVVESVVKIFTTGEPIEDDAYIAPDWNYFLDDATVALGAVTVPANAFVYLDYSNDWTYEKAAKVADSLNDLISEVLVMAGADAATVSDLLAGVLPLDDYLTAENLNKLLALISDFTSVVDETLATVINVVIGSDLSVWAKETFMTPEEAGDVEWLGEDEDLRYIDTVIDVLDSEGQPTGELKSVRAYEIADREDFVYGLCKILEPAEAILGWLLMGDTYGFFVDNASGQEVLLKLYGADGYSSAVTLLLEALGCEGLISVDADTTTGAIIESMLLSILARVDEIMADPVNEVLDLIPEILYFINAHGLHAVINNLVSGLQVVLTNVEPIIGQSVELDALLTELIKNLYEDAGLEVAENFTFSTEDIDLASVIDIAETLTGLNLTGVLGSGYALEKFVLGDVKKYDSASMFDAYKAVLASTGIGDDEHRDRADLITIVLSLVLDIIMYKDSETDNAAVLEGMLNLGAGTIDAVAALLKAHTTEIVNPDWFYFDETVDDWTEFTASTIITMPERTINYIEYTTDWTEETADYLSDNLDSIIAAVLKLAGQEETVVAAIIEQYFTLDDLYDAEILNSISTSVASLVDSLGETIVDVAGTLLDCDIASYKALTFTDEQINGRGAFEEGLVEILKPIYAVLDWFLFGDDIGLFYNNEAYGEVNGDEVDGYDLLSVSGFEGYAYGLAPILEAIGVELPTYVSGASTAEDIVPGVITAILDFAETVLADPVNEVLAIIPNVLYFINANGLSAAVQNLVGALTCMLEDASAALDKLGVEIGDYDLTSTQALVDSVIEGVTAGTALEGLEIDLDNINLGSICDIVTDLTGIAIRDVLVDNGLENFFLGEVVYNSSATVKPSFKMVYTEDEDRAELITILVNLVLDVAMYGNNPAVIDELVGTDGTVQAVVEMIRRLNGTDIEYPYEVNWNYFEGTVDGTYGTAGSTITPPATPFNNYLTYTSDWTKETANYLYENLDTIATSILTMIKKEPTSVASLISGVNLYQGKMLNSLVNSLQTLIWGEVNEDTGLREGGLDDALIGAIDAIVGTDINGWKTLSYEDRDMTPAEFVTALQDIFSPAYSLLDWLLFGDDLEYFVQDKTGETLIKISGNEGYATGLAVILEAIGVELPAYYESTASCETMMPGVLTAITVRIAEIFNDPVNEVLEILPNILYYINTAGLSVAVKNLLGSVIGVLPEIGDLIGKNITLENILPELVGIDLNLADLDLNEILSYVETLDALKGLKIAEVFTGNYENDMFVQAADGSENLFDNFYLGDVAAYKSSTGYTMYRMNYEEGNKGDLLTMLLSIVLQVAIYEGNAAPLAELIGVPEETIIALVQILTSGVETQLSDINWTYYLGLTDEAAINAKITELATATTTAINGIQIERTSNYLKYSNNWNEETATYLCDNLESIVDLVINMVTDSEFADLEALLGSIDVINNLYSDSTVDLIVGKVAGLLNKAVDAIGPETLTAAGHLLSADVMAVKNYQSRGVSDKESFAKSLAAAFSPLGEVLDLLLFGRDYEFFTKLADGTNSIIKINGGEGWKYGLAPVLAALGVDTHIEAEVAAATDDKSVTEQVLELVLTKVCDRIDDILADPVNEVLALLPELIYFINADGATVAVSNLLAPADALLAAVGTALGMDGSDPDKKDITSVAKIANLAILDDLGFEAICDLVKTKTGVDVWGALEGYIDAFYFGQLTHYTSYDAVDGFRMEYSDTEEVHDFVTVLLTMVLDVATHENNEQFFIDLFDNNLVKDEDKDENQTKAKQMYYSVLAILTNNYELLEYQDFDWLFVTKAPVHPEWIDTGVAVSPLMTGSDFGFVYGELYKREMGEYITKWLPDFIDTMIVLLGIEGANGDIYRSLDDLLQGLVGNSVYTTDLLYTLLDVLNGLYPLIESKLGEELASHVAAVVYDSLGVDLKYWNGYTVNNFAEGDRNAFVNELVRMLKPAYPLLKWLLIEGEDIALFTTGDTGDNYIVLKGADGYAYSIVPLLEALHCEGIKSPAAFKAEADADLDTMLTNILTPLLDRVDEVLADPVNEVLDLATSAIYFLNSNAADTCFKNLLNAVLSVVDTIEPITGEINVYELIGLDLTTFDIEGLLGQLLQNIEEEQGFKLTQPALSALKELTVGTLRSFTSLNGNKAYTMDYAVGGDQTDLVSVILRFAMTFIAMPENVGPIKAMLKDKLSAEGYKFVEALLDNFSNMVGTAEGMDTVLYTIYYIFYAANVAAHKTENWIAEFNGNYSFMDQLFATSDLAFFRQLEKSFGGLLNKWTDQVINTDGVMTDGAIPFFTKIANFFKKIIEFFKNLFKFG